MPACPKCSKSDEVRRILWGMPDSEVDESVFYIAGCLVDPNPLEFICQGCDYQFGARSKQEEGWIKWS